MRKLHKLGSFLLITTVTLVSFLALSILANSLAIDKGGEASPAMSQNQQKSLLDWLFGKKQGRGASRGEFCSIWPNKTDSDLLVIWNQRPVFVWQGNLKRIEVGLPYYKQKNEDPLWSYDVQPNEWSVLYNGSPLEPGQEYHYWAEYQITDKQGNITTESTDSLIPFEIMEDRDRRNMIEAKMVSIDTQTQTMNPEEIALKKAKYFSEQELWSDVIREIFLVRNPSPKLTSVIEEIRHQEECVIKPRSTD